MTDERKPAAPEKAFASILDKADRETALPRIFVGGRSNHLPLRPRHKEASIDRQVDDGNSPLPKTR